MKKTLNQIKLETIVTQQVNTEVQLKVFVILMLLKIKVILYHLYFTFLVL